MYNKLFFSASDDYDPRQFSVEFREIVMSVLILLLFLISEPVVFFDAKDYSVDESEKFVDVKLRRIGTDLRNATSVTVRSKKAQPQPAQGKHTMLFNTSIVVGNIYCNWDI